MKNKIQRAWWSIHAKMLRSKKLKFVTWLDKKRPGKYCWADCVAWAYSTKRLNPFKIDNARGCRIESQEHPCKLCYCGQWENGVCFFLLPKQEQERLNAEFQEKYKVNMEELPF